MTLPFSFAELKGLLGKQRPAADATGSVRRSSEPGWLERYVNWVGANQRETVDQLAALTDPKHPGGVQKAVGLLAGMTAPLEKAAQAAAEAAPAVISRERWKPISRIFDRSVPDNQGTRAPDMRLAIPVDEMRGKPSPLVQAVVDSKTVRQGLRRDMERGLPLGGDNWYNTAPVDASLRSIPGAMSPEEWHLTGAGSSASNSVANELSAGTIINYARKRGLPLFDAVDEFMKKTGSQNRPTVMQMHRDFADAGVEAGQILPNNPRSRRWKIPSYGNHRTAGGGLLDPMTVPGQTPALDTHELRRMMQFVMENPRLKKLARSEGAVEQALANAGGIPVRNALDYGLLSTMYTDNARALGLKTAGQAQAGRWIGGATHTGLKSAPVGDYTSILEDAIKYSAQMRGLDDSPKGLVDYWARIAKGDDFILPWFLAGPHAIR